MINQCVTKPKLLILIRHAESRLNACRKEHIHQPWHIIKNGISHVIDPGIKDAPLTQLGRRQAEQAGKKLAKDIRLHRLPPIQLVTVSPLRRTMHTARLITDSVDRELKLSPYNSNWWYTPSSLSNTSHRSLTILPFLRECRTTLADKPCVRKDRAVEYWAERPVDLRVVQKEDFQQVRFDPTAAPRTRDKIGHFLTIGLTSPCRKVKVESLNSVCRRIQVMEVWLRSLAEDVVLIVGHNNIFKAWQEYWKCHNPNVRWASRRDLLGLIEKESLGKTAFDWCGGFEDSSRSTRCGSGSTAASSTQEGGFEDVLLRNNVNEGRQIYEFANTACLLVSWQPA